MIVCSLSILLGIFMYKNPDEYFIVICGFLIGLINIFFLLVLMKAIINCFTARIENFLNKLYVKLHYKLPKCLNKFFTSKNKRNLEIIK